MIRACNLVQIKAENVRRCLEQIRLGYATDQLRLMGFAEGCIIEARRFIDDDKGPYGKQNHEVTGCE